VEALEAALAHQRAKVAEQAAATAEAEHALEKEAKQREQLAVALQHKDAVRSTPRARADTKARLGGKAHGAA
jgi:hypothetical protein